MYAICSHCYGSKNTAASALPLAPLFPFVYKISGWYCGGCLCALLRRVLAFFAGYFFSSTWLSITIFLQNMAIMTGRGHGHQHKWALIMVANGVILRYASNSKEQPNLVFSAWIGTPETVGIIRFLGFLLFHSVFRFLPDSLRMLLSLASVFESSRIASLACTGRHPGKSLIVMLRLIGASLWSQ